MTGRKEANPLEALVSKPVRRVLLNNRSKYGSPVCGADVALPDNPLGGCLPLTLLALEPLAGEL